MKRIFLFLVKSLLVIILLFNLIILFSGRWYLYKAIYNTYLQGRSGPNALEFRIFENRKIPAASNPEPWPFATHYNSKLLPATLEQRMREVGSIALVIVKNDSLLHEQYWDNFSDTSHTNSFSMAKSYVGALLGFAIKDGLIKSIDQPVSDYIPEFKNDWRKQVTLKHLVTMTSGIAFDESYANPFAFPAEGYYGSDLLQACINYNEKESEPGTVYHYLSGNTALLGYCISKAAGKPLATYLHEKIWEPLGCERPAYWSLDKGDGLEKAFCCINSNARDFAKLGKLYMHCGNWNGKQLLDSNYVAQSVIPYACKETDGTENHTYGYSWWLTSYKGLKVFYMRGMLGQYVICVPEKKLVITRLAQLRRPPGPDHCPLDVGYCIDAALEMYGN